MFYYKNDGDLSPAAWSYHKERKSVSNLDLSYFSSSHFLIYPLIRDYSD